jgi:hypothetical protein
MMSVKAGYGLHSLDQANGTPSWWRDFDREKKLQSSLLFYIKLNSLLFQKTKQKNQPNTSLYRKDSK